MGLEVSEKHSTEKQFKTLVRKKRTIMLTGKTPADEWEIDYEKLSKLEKMIVRVDADIQRMQRENDKLLIVETLKKVVLV